MDIIAMIIGLIAMIIGLVVIAAILVYVVQHQLRAFQERMQSQVRGDLEGVRTAMSAELGGVRKEVQDQLGGVTQNLIQMQGQVTTQMQQGATALTDTLSGIKRDMGELAQATERIREVGQDIASLQEILRTPKIRGGLGELTLENLLAQVFPAGGDYYATQHRFSDGSMVDAVIRIGKSLVPVDAKFPLENFREMTSAEDDSKRAGFRRAFLRDVRQHIDDIAGKYIQPAEGTYDFAFMYIPAENIYYEVIIKPPGANEQDLNALAMERHVVPVSPNTLYAYLRVVVLGLRGLHIEERAQEIVRGLSALRSDFARFAKEFEILGRHIQQAHTKYDDADKRLGRFETKLTAAAEAALPSEEAPPTALTAPESAADDSEA